MPDAETQTEPSLLWGLLGRVRVLRTPRAVLEEVIQFRARIRAAALAKSPAAPALVEMCDRYYRRDGEELWVLPEGVHCKSQD